MKLTALPTSLFCSLLAFCFVVASPVFAQASDEIDFNRDIRPILSDTCFKCHGPDEHSRAADLRLDLKEHVFDVSGVVVPGDLETSELYQRITAEEDFLLMPPADSGRSLTDEQKQKLKRWIESGAKWDLHWSFEKLDRPTPPELSNERTKYNEIDQFVLTQLQKHGLTPAEEADKRTLVRRVTFDLTGLPPSQQAVEEFINDSSPNAYERLVDRLLDSPRYGEHMARFWLDAARYGDTHGLHLDNYREMWPYRDWVINAFNRNMPFDRFGTEQLAGDLLDDPSDAQRIATGFNRAHVTTAEGGSIVEEVYVRNVIDRVNTTGTVFMGLTVGCAQCHDHKFDPISQREYYQLFAFFNNLDGNAMDGNRKDHAPVLKVPDTNQKAQLKSLNAQLAAQQKSLEDALAQYKSENGDFVKLESEDVVLENKDTPQEFVWVDDELPVGSNPTGPWEFVDQNQGPVFSGKRASKRTAEGLSQHFFIQANIPLKVDEQSKLFTYVYLDPENPPQEIMLQWNDGNWDHRAYWGENKIDWGQEKSPARFYMGPLPEVGTWVRLEINASDVGLNNGSLINGWAFTQFGGTVYWDRSGIISKVRQRGGYHSYENWFADQKALSYNGLPGELKKIAQLPVEKRNQQQTRKLQRFFLINAFEPARAVLKPISEQITSTKKSIDQLNQKIPTTLVWKERKDVRKAYMLKRGQYDQRGDEVSRATPGMLPALPEDVPKDRLGFAKWLFSEEHPLTARVTVNRFWQQLFGRGIVVTSEDFGAQGQWPSHPMLLDWLSSDFRDSGWDVKRLMKTMVMSATYRQSSRVTPEKLAIDPKNRWLSRGPRYRLDAEMLRDQALFVSGLMVEEIGGPSVKPPQPDGLWFAVGYSGSNTVRFKKDEGHNKVHRRSLYTFWKRTAPPPQMNMFDAPSRESCSVRRERTNTPLQALLLMNDPQYVEAARYLANTTLENRQDTRQQIQWMFAQVTCRPATNSEIDKLESLYQQNLVSFNSDPNRAKTLTSIGEKPATGTDAELCKLAAMTTIANLVLNLDEVVTKN